VKRLDKMTTDFTKKITELYFDKLDEMIADKRIDNLKFGKSTVVPLEEVFKKVKQRKESFIGMLDGKIGDINFKDMKSQYHENFS
jgi:hypothetical protein